jgi:cation diffusion facilitator family transporter
MTTREGSPEGPSQGHGSHGGPLVAVAGGFVEISVFETGLPPRFRLYFFDERKQAVAPPPGGAEIETVRPDGRRQSFTFQIDAGFLESVSEILEPHEFRVVLALGVGAARHLYETLFTEEGHAHEPGHGHEHGGHAHGGHVHAAGHGHAHGIVDPTISTTARGLWTVKWSFVALFATALLQLVVVVLSNSVALLADMVHNLGDAATAIPLGVAFLFARRPPNRRFTFGFGRVEDLAGLAVVLTITASAVVAGYEAIQRLVHPQPVSHLGAIVAASIVGFVGNEAVAIFRIRVGKQIGSAALIADGYHARTDGWTSLAVLVGAVGVHLGYPLADPIVGLVITVAILGVVWESVKMVFSRMLDGVEPEVIDRVHTIAREVHGVTGVTDVRARWVGHRLRAEVNVSVGPELTVQVAHEIAKDVEHHLQHHLPFLSGAIIHLDPVTEAGESKHRKGPHAHDDLPTHSH